MAEDTAIFARLRYSDDPQPVLSIFTMAFKRPMALERNRTSLARQTEKRFEQLLLQDPSGHDFAWVGQQLACFADRANGEFVMGLDDDDELAYPEAVADLAAVIESHRPDVIVTRFGLIWSSGRRVIIPETEFWGRPPVFGHISGQNVVARREIWVRHAQSWKPQPETNGAYDYAFVSAVLHSGYSVYWLDREISRMQYRGLGRTEDQIEARLPA